MISYQACVAGKCSAQQSYRFVLRVAAKPTATASGSRGATGCMPLHRDLQEHCCACQHRISRRRIDCRDPQRSRQHRHVELRAASLPQLYASRVERDRVRAYERHVVELGFNNGSTDT